MLFTKRFTRPVGPIPRPQLADVIAGVSVAMVLIPQSVAYASLAGMPAQIGLFASALPLLVFSLFASSPYLQSGPTAVTSLLTFSALSGSGHALESADYVKAGALLALIVGVIRLLVGLLSGGRLAFVVAEPVMIGFTSGAAIVILATQLPKVLGVVPPSDIDGPLRSALWSLGEVSNWQWLAVMLALATLLLTIGGKRLHPLFPGVLVAVVVGLTFSLMIDMGSEFDRAVAGDPNAIPGRFPTLGLDLPWGDVWVLLVGGLVISFIGFAEPSAIARTYANEEREQWDASREFAASGLANVTAALSGAYPIGGSFSRSSVNKLSGAKTRLSGGITGLVVLAFLPLAPVLDELPNAVLGAIVIGAVLSLIKPRRLMELWSRSPSQAILTYTTLALTVLLAPDVYWAVVIGGALTVVHHFVWPVRVETAPRDNGIEIRPEGLVWLGSNARFASMLDAAVAESETTGVVAVDLSAIASVDVGMADAIAATAQRLKEAGRSLIVLNGPIGAEAVISAAMAQRPSIPAVPVVPAATRER